MFNPLRSTGSPPQTLAKVLSGPRLLYGVSLISILTSLFLFALAVSFSRIALFPLLPAASAAVLAATDAIIANTILFVNPFFQLF